MSDPTRKKKFPLIWFGSLLGRRWWFVPIIIAAASLRVGGLGKSIWVDEAWSIEWSRPAEERIQEKAASAVHPSATGLSAYEVNLVVYRICDALRRTGSIILVRLPILLIGLLTIWLGWAFGRVWKWWLLSVWLALALAIWPYKAFWDTTVRHYSIMICMFVAMIVAWERYRQQSSWRRYSAGLLLTGLASLTHVIAIVSLIVPPIYLLWDAVRGLIKNRPTNTASPRTIKSLLNSSFKWILFLFFVLVIIQINRGPDWTLLQLRKYFALHSDGRADNSHSEDEPANPEQDPTTIATLAPAAAITHIAKAIVAVISRIPPSPWPLFDLETSRTREFSSFFFRGYGAADHGAWKMRFFLDPLLTIALLAGSIVTLIKSPPLLVSLWSYFFFVCIMLYHNYDRHFMDVRFYTMPFLIVLLLITIAFASLTEFISRRLLGSFIRAHIVFRVKILLMTVAFSMILTASAVQSSARFTYNDWDAIYEFCRNHSSESTLITGINPKSIRFINDLAAFQSQYRKPAEFWKWPGHNDFFDAGYKYYIKDWPFIDLLNPHSTVAFFMPFKRQPEFFPIKNYNNLFETMKADAFEHSSIWVQMYNLANNLFITRGRCTVPLLPRFQIPPELNQPVHYQVMAYYEVPGTYNLTIGQTPDARLTGVVADGRMLSYTTRLGSQSARDGDVCNTASLNTPPASRLYPSFRQSIDGSTPVCLDSTAEYVIRITTPPNRMTSQTLDLYFDAPIADNVPILEWSYLQSQWTPVTSYFDIGPVTWWEDYENFHLSAPVRLAGPSAEFISAKVYIHEMERDKPESIAQVSNLISPWRDYQPGDIAWLPITIPKWLATYYIKERQLQVSLNAYRTLPFSNTDPRSISFLDAGRAIAPNGAFLMCYTRFERDKSGKWITIFEAFP